MVSCKSIETMVEKGEYEKAFNYAVDKLAGEKQKDQIRQRSGKGL